MTQEPLPPGRYLTCPIDVRAEYGGQTRALLMRNRIFAAEAGVRPTVLMFGAAADMEERRAALLGRGLLTPEVELVNIYEYYRTRDWPDTPSLGRTPEDVSAYRTAEETLTDGSPFRATYTLPDGTDLHEYLRPDGSPFLRVPAFSFGEESSWPRFVQLVSRTGELVGEHPSIGSWFRSWVEELSTEDEDTFVFMDSRFIAPHLAALDRPRIHLVYLLHNIHLGGDRSWNGPMNDVYERLLRHVGDMDAFVTLTDRQRGDIAQRFGRRSHLFVVPNPVDTPPEPVTVRRDPRLVTVVARLEGQKRLGHALKAFRKVVRRLPDARLEIYGDGSRRDQLETLADRLGVSGAVTFKGHDPRAREALWHSSAFMLTSQFEGYPLSTLESFSHGCPVVAYDIKYGPREQITDGVDGFLVPDGDMDGVADRIVRLLEDPLLVEQISDAARRKALDHGPDRFLRDWNHVLTEAMRLKSRRTCITEASAEVTRMRVRSGLLARLRRREPSGVLEVDAQVRLRGTSSASTLQDAEVTLDAVTDGGVVTALPVATTTAGGAIGVRCRADLRGAGAADPSLPGTSATLRLRVVWQNSAWETALGRLMADMSVVVSPGTEPLRDEDGR